MFKDTKTIFFSLAIILILNGLFNIGFRLEDRKIASTTLKSGESVETTSLLRLYYSKDSCEKLYYTYASLILGKPIEATASMEDKITFNPSGEERRKSGLSLMPYRDFVVEYPPLALPLIIVPRLFADTHIGYSAGLAAVITVILFLCLFIVIKIATGLGEISPEDRWRYFAYTAAFVFLLGPLLVTRIDILPVFFILLSILMVTRDRDNLAAVFIACAAMSKFYPVIILPLLWIKHLRHRQYAKVLTTGLIFTLTVGLIALPFLLPDPAYFLTMFTYHSQRGLQLESLYSTLILLAHTLFDYPVQIMEGAGSDNLVSSVTSGLPKASFFIMFACFVAVYIRHFLSTRHDAGRTMNIRAFISSTLLLTAAFILSGKVGSAQFIIWFFPLILLIGPTHRRSILTVFLFYALATQAEYHGLFSLLLKLKPAGIIALAIRQTALIVLTVLLWRSSVTPSSATKAAS